jgi:hypothetical protein
MYHVLVDRSANLMNFVSDGRYSPQVEGTPTLICWLLLPDPRNWFFSLASEHRNRVEWQAYRGKRRRRDPRVYRCGIFEAP